MPNDVSPGYNSGRVDLSGAPGADQDWDSLFLNPELAASQPQAASGTNTQQTPQATQTNQPFLKAGETVYNSAEDAINGTIHKDQLIDKYRSFLTENGIDPNTFQRKATEPAPQAQTQPTNNGFKYYNNPNFFDEVAAAAANRDRVKYERLLAEHTREAIQSELAPWRPTLAETNRFKAFRQVNAEIPGFQNFFEGPGFKEVQDKFPLYKEMLQIGENDPNAAQRLPEVYQQMYVLYQGLNAGRNQTQSNTTAPTTTPTVQTRPTLQTSSLTPPPPTASTTGWQESNWKGNRSLNNDARKQLIQDGDSKFRGMKFEDLGL